LQQFCDTYFFCIPLVRIDVCILGCSDPSFMIRNSNLFWYIWSATTNCCCTYRLIFWFIFISETNCELHFDLDILSTKCYDLLLTIGGIGTTHICAYAYNVSMKDWKLLFWVCSLMSIIYFCFWSKQNKC
jgi:hypothetical protein